MGRKSKSKLKGEAVPSCAHQTSIHSRPICKTVDDLWQLLQNSPNEQLVSLWEEYDGIQGLICRLRDLQVACPETNRADHFPVFEKWLKENGAIYHENLAIAEIPAIGYGLRCAKDLKRDTKVLQIPEHLMMSSQTALAGALGALVSKDHMLKSMSNVTLALHLLNERHSADSFWKPYIDTLPHCFSLPLYFTKVELLLLQGSPSLVRCLLQIRNITKLYSHLHRIIRAANIESLPLCRSGFTYDDFVWAVSCVMSRQNEIPSKPTLPSPTLALIPLWDLCNHSSGSISTFFNVETSTCDCYAQQDFRADEEFRIFYGGRSNLELLLQQGFVYPLNDFDSYLVKLGLSTKEEHTTRSLKLQLLQMIDLPQSGLFPIIKLEQNPFSPELCAYVRIFTAPLKVLQHLISDGTSSIKLKSTCWERDDLRALDFLEKRCSLLLMQYPTTVEEDEKILKTGPLPSTSASAVNLRICEKKLLLHAISYAKGKLVELNRTDQKH